MKHKFAVVAGAVLTSFALVACGQGTQPVQNSQNTNQTAVGNQTGAKGTTNSSANAASSGSNTAGNAGGVNSSGGNSTGSNTTANSNGASSSNTTSNSSGKQGTQGSQSTSSTVKAQGGPLPGDLLIADRGNSRLLIVTPQKKIVWEMSIPNHGPRNANSLGADDAFFTPDGKHIIINEEDNQMIGVIDIATKKFVWTYGHPGVAGSAPGYLNTPDDAYMLPNGDVTVADIKNERILVINPSGHIVKQYGTGSWYHNPPKSFAAPNGDTPLPDGGMLVTEIGGSYADRLNKNGQLMYTVHFPNISYPSDSQLLPSGNILVVDYNTPGRAEIVNRQGHIVWQYYKTSGPGELRNPSLALPLANGDIVLNDDYNDRVVVIDPQTNKIVWQYGHTGVPGTAPGYLNTPDGLDIMPSNVTLPGGN